MPNPVPSTVPPPRRPWLAALAMVAVFAAHITLASRLFPSLGSIVEPESPVVVVDHAIHEYHGALGARFVREAGTTWGYDPFFMAGYPETPVWDSSSNPAILFELLGGPSGFRPYKVGLFACSVGLLLAVAGGAWAAGLGMAEVALASALAFLVFWTGFPVALWRSGLFAFITAAAGVGLLLGLCTLFDRKPNRWSWLAMALAGSGLFYLHVTAPVMAFGGLLAFYATRGPQHGWRWHAAILGAAGLAVAMNLPWLAALWKFRGLRVGSGFFMTTDSAWFLVEFFTAASVEGRMSLALLILGIPGLVLWGLRGRGASAAAFGGGIVALMLLTGLGSLWGPTKTLEPLRFRVTFLFLLAVPASSGVVEASKGLARLIGGGVRGRVAAALAWFALLGGWAATERPFFESCWGYLTYRRPLVVGIKPEMTRLVEWLRANTDLSARILFEDQLRLLERTDPESVHWTPLLPTLLGPDSRMFIGGIYQTAFIKHHEMAAFGDFQLGNRSIDEWSPAQVDAYCRTYNVGWVACWSPLSRFWFDRYPGAVKVATLPRYSSPDLPPSNNEQEWRAMVRRAGREVATRYLLEGERSYAIYRVERPRSYFLRGKGRIVAVAPNRVELADVEPEGGSVVVSLHWLDTWKSDPPLTLKPEPTPGDPVEFVRIDLPGPVARVVLTNGYGR